MNKIREHIIDLISDYMDKDLSEGCLVKDFEDNYDKIFYILDEDNICLINDDMSMHHELNELEIIGHYDITAVLKYIDDYLISDEIGYRYIASSGNNFVIDYREYGQEFKIYTEGCFPNKPLHLYTEQEEKELLELLLKLK